MLHHFEKNKVLTNLNHGFRSGYSCETQLAVTIDELSQNVENGEQTDVIILDFSKAFDMVPHKLLLHKLNCYGIRGQLLKWLENFLTKRKMKVVVDGQSSKDADVLSGVPQGTVLGPILFLVHINDLPERVSSCVRLFADDCLLYRVIRTIQDHIALQEDLKNLEKWAAEWGMKFNAVKCYTLPIKQKTFYMYQLDNTFLKEVTSNPYLGLNISDDLTWNYHINSMCKKASSTLGFIRRNLQRCPKETRLMAYRSLVRSTLEYGAVIWDPFTQNEVDKIERLQRQAARFIHNDFKSKEKGCVTKMLSDLDLPTLQQRRKELRLTFLYKIAEDLVPAIPSDKYLKPIRDKRKRTAKVFPDHVSQNPVDKYETNNTRPFIIPEAKNSKQYKNSFFVRTIQEWNRLDNSVVNAESVNCFKARLRKD